MKKFSLIFSLLLVSILSFGQNGIYVYGIMNNAPDFPVEIDVYVYTNPIAEGLAFSGLNDEITPVFIELPSSDWTSMVTAFVDCNGNEVVNTFFNNSLPPLVDVFIELDYCNSDTIYGCTNPTAINYNPEAYYDDGSCIFQDPSLSYLADSTSCLAWFNLAGVGPGIQVTWDFGDGTPPLIAPNYVSHNFGFAEYFEVCASYQNPNGTIEQLCVLAEIEGCLNTIYGCTDPAALNYNPLATADNGTCVYNEDCTGVEAILLINNNENAIGNWNIQLDGVLIASESIDQDFQDHSICLEDGCYTINFNMEDANNESGFFTLWLGEDLGANDMLVNGYTSFQVNVGQGCGVEIYGCTYPSAINYNPDATIDDGSCIFDAAENDLCADAITLETGTILIDNTAAIQNEDIWGECWSFGSGEGEQTSLWYSFTTPEEPSTIHIEAIGDGTNTLTDTQFGLFEECGGEMIYCDGNSGYGLLSAFHFECGELEPNTEYILMVDGYYGDAGTCYLSYDVQIGCDTLVYGCTDPFAVNYNPQANIDDGSCQYIDSCGVYLMTSYTSCDTYTITAYTEGGNNFIDGNWYVNGLLHEDNQTLTTIEFTEAGTYDICFLTENTCGILVEECTSITIEPSCFDTCPELFIVPDSTGCGAWHYVEGGNPNDMYTWYFGDGGTENASSGVYHEYSGPGYFKTCIAYEPTANCSAQEICAYVQISGCDVVYGCTDPLASNYDPLATMDNGTCEYDSIYCYPYVIADQFDCNAYSFYAFMEGPVADIPGFWSINGVLVEDNTSIFTFIAEEPGDYEICFESYSDVCQMGIFECEIITVTEDCFTDCPELIIYNDSLNCSVDFELSGVSPNETVIWYIDDNPAITAGPYLNYIFNQSDYYTFCAVYDGGNCDEIEFCGTVYVTGCDDDVYGCTDPLASNYDPLATMDNGTCEYDSIYCYPYVIANQFDCNAYSFYAFIEGPVADIPGFWSVNGVLVEDNTSIFTFIAEEPGDYEICFESYSDVCQMGIFECEIITVTEDCFTDCPELIIYNDSLNCSVDMELSGVSPNETVIWYIDGNAAITAGPYLNYIFSESGYHSFCAVYEGGECDVIEFCDQVYISGCDEDIYGCTDPEAENYNPFATIDDGTCTYQEECDANLVSIMLATSNWGYEISWNIYNSEGITVASGDGYQTDQTYFETACLEDGCYVLEMLDSYGDGWNGGVLTMTLNNETIISGTLSGGSSGFMEFGINDSSCITTIYGCTDPNAINYNPEATINDGSCQYNNGCDGTEAVLLINNSAYASGTWELLLDGNIIGQDSLYSDFQDYTMCIEDGCYTLNFNVEGGNGQAGFFTLWLNGDIMAGNDYLILGASTFEISVGDGCDDQDIYGCTDPEATNYNPMATIDDGSCYYNFNCNIGFTIYPDSTGENTLWVVPDENLWDATSVLWTFGDGASSTEMFPQHEYTGEGPYTLCVTAVLTLDNGGSCQATFCAIVTSQMLGSGLGGSNGFFLNIVDQSVLTVDNNDPFGELNLWPNPANNLLNLKFDSNSSNEINLSIMDVTGKVVYNQIIGGKQGVVSNEIDIHNLADGMYMVSLQNENGVTTKRFVVSR